MKGALEELNEPVDDLMEVSKVQTQILNLTHNQVDIFDKETETFRSTYDIMKDIADVWDSLNSTNQASLTEILFGKNRANVGLALIQAYQSGTVEDALNKSLKSEGTATEEYEKMMEGIQSHTNALKGSLQELANTITKSDTINSILDKGKGIVNFLNEMIKKTGSLAIVLAPILGMWSYKTGANIISILKSIAVGFGLIKGEALNAQKALIALKTAGSVALSAISGIVISLVISKFSEWIDKLITTKEEMNEMATEAADSMVDLKNKTEELNNTKDKLDEIAENYSKIATTVTDATDRQTQLQELQQELISTYQVEADKIDLVNGKYSEQIKTIKELKDAEEERYKRDNAGKIADAERWSNLYVDDIYKAGSSPYMSYDYYGRQDAKKGDRSLYSIADLDERVSAITANIEGAYASLRGTFDLNGIYLSGSLEDAHNQLEQIIEEYGRISDYDTATMESLRTRYAEIGVMLETIAETQPYRNNTFDEAGIFKSPKEIASALEDALNGIGDAIESDSTFYNKLDEAYEKLQTLANPENLSMDEYVQLQLDIEALNGELYNMAGNSAEAKKEVDNLFNGFNYGIKQNDDGLEKFVQRFETNLEETFKSTAEIISVVQDGMENLGEGKGLAHTDAWKLLKDDSEGYLKTIKIINGEYYFSEEELIKYKDAKIKKSQEELRVENTKAATEMHNLALIIEREKRRLQLLTYGTDEYTKTAIGIEESEKALEGYSNIIIRNNYLIEELNQNLGNTRTASVGMATELNNAIKGFENEVKAIERSVDELNNRKDVLESEKKAMEDELDILNEQKKVLEDQQKLLKKAVDDYLKRYEDSMQSQLDAIKQQKDDIKDEYDERIKALKSENEERDLAYKKEKALLDLNQAKQQQVRTYSSARGWEYGVSKEKLAEAQKNLDDVLLDEQIQNLEKERDELIKPLEKQEKEYEKHIKAYQEYAKLYETTTEEIENADAELLAEQLLGSEWREKIEQKDEGLLNTYKQEYQNYTNKISDLTKNDIKNLEDRIKAKQAEIDKTDEQIKAYNNYKNTVQNNLNEAKNALEEYKNNATQYFGEMADSFDSMENRIWEKHNRILLWLDEIVSAANNMKNGLEASGIARGAMYLAGIGSFAKGGAIDYTGLAMVHGSKSSSETAFNATDSKKLYDMVHNTPNLIASIVKQSGQLGGFNPSNITNSHSTNTSSINVHIGQVVANNPAELTRNLDTHLDGYFRRKLTQGYAQ